MTCKQLERIVTITPLAVERVKEFMAKDKENANGSQIFVQPGGCSGYPYGMMLEKTARSDDCHGQKTGLTFTSINRAQNWSRG